MFQKLLKPHIRRFVLHSAPWLIVAVLGVIFASISAYSAYQIWSYQPFTIVPENTLIPSPQSSTSAGLKKNTVEISGAVIRPGVYEVSEGSRWQEVVLMANGFNDMADKKFIHQELNLAEKIKDQSKLYIPFASESGKVSTTSIGNVDSPSPQTALFVNTASGPLWDEIEGIGEARVKSILSGVPYIDKNDFIERSGITLAIYEHIEEKYSEIIY